VRRVLLLLLLLLPSLASAEGLAGRLLVASPRMPPNPFSETVILICSHDATGAFGLVVNRRAGHAEADGRDGGTAGFTLRLGGPVEPKLLFLLMTAEAAPPEALSVPGGFAVGNPSPFLAGELQPPRRATLVVGFSGWDPGQLEAELRHGDWLVQDADEETVFGERDEAKWQRAVNTRKLEL
jgi:putative transcriptional regulator